MSRRANNSWWNADKDETSKAVFDYVRAVEGNQFDLYNRFVRLAALYNPNAPGPYNDNRSNDARIGLVTENVIASNIDTVTAIVAATEVRARFMTDDGDWSTQRQAKRLEWYAEGLSALLGIDEKCRVAFKAAALKGTGVVFVFIDEFNELQVENVMIDDIIVDELEARNGDVQQMHRRRMVDREKLCARFPEHEDAIENAQMTGDWRTWAGYRPISNNNLVCLESWKLPIGRDGKDGYKPGRHTITIDGTDLLDEEWHEGFPFAIMRWTKDEHRWFGVSLAERIAGIQQALNKRNLQIDRQLDLGAFPTTYVPMIDAALTVKTINKAGSVVPYKGQTPPHTVIPQAVSPETYQSRNDLKASAFQESGVSQMASQAVKPAGIDSGVAMREYRDQTTQRFAPQGKGLEQLKLDVVELALRCCKRLKKDAPEITRRRRGQGDARKIKWSQVDMRDVRVQICAASTLSRTPAGRMQSVIEWAQAGIISQDEARRLMDHPDLESAISLYTAKIEAIEQAFESIEEGEIVMPEPFDDLKMIAWRGTAHYQKLRGDNAPEDVLEGLRQYISQAAYMLSMASAPPTPGAMPANDNAPAEMGAPPAMESSAPTSALAAQAMQLRSA